MRDAVVRGRHGDAPLRLIRGECDPLGQLRAWPQLDALNRPYS